MQKYVCDVCGYIYDPEVGDPDNGVAAGTAFADIPDVHNRRHEKTEGCFPADENAAVRSLEKRLIWQLYLTIL